MNLIRASVLATAAGLLCTTAIAGFSPGNLDGLILWLDADDVATMEREASTGRVLSWRDKSEAAHEAKPHGDLPPPVHVPDLLNGRGLVRFDGRNALLLGKPDRLDLEGGDDLTFFAVVRARSNGSILARTDGSNLQYRFHIPGERTLRVAFGSGGDHIDTISTVDSRRFSLLSVVNADRDGTQRFEMFFDGERENAGDAGEGRFDAPVVIGARDDGTTQRLSFDLAELIVFDRALSPSEREQVERYLTGRFALEDQQVFDRELTDAPEDTFTLAVIPDTQRYHGPGSGRGDESGEPRNPAFDSRTLWLAENLDSQRIVFVTHMGDIVDRNNHEQWQVARENMDRLHGRVPYGIAVGNHDMVNRTGDSSLFQEYFGAGRYENKPWYGGTYEGRPGHKPEVSGNNANSYQLFSAGGLDFIIVHVECNAPDDVLEWTNRVLEEHRNRMAIVSTHMYLGPIPQPESRDEWLLVPQGRMQWKKVHGERGNTPQEMWEKSFSLHPNLFLVLAGDQSGVIALRQEVEGSHGNVVHEVMQDYPRHADDSDWLRLFRFHPEKEEIEVLTYSPAQDRLCDGIRHVMDPEDHQFRLDISGAIADHRARRGAAAAGSP